MQADQRGGARGVDRDGRALQAQGIGDPARHHAARRPGEGVTAACLGRVHQDGRVLLRGAADEDAGAAAAQADRIEPGAFQRLPRGLQQQPLLRIHRQCLTRRDPEERRVEVAGLGQEGTLPGSAGLLDEGVHGQAVPASVGGEVRHLVAAVDEQTPEVLGTAHPAGEAAGHAHDHDRVVVGRPQDRQCRLRGAVEELLVQVPGETLRCGVVEDEGGGQAQAGGRVQPVAQFHRGQGVESEVPERPPGRDVVRRPVGEHGRRFGADEFEQPVVLFGGGEPGQGLAQGGVGAVVGRGLGVLAQRAGDFGDVLDQRAAPGDGVAGGEARPVHVGDGQRRLVLLQRLSQGLDGQCRFHRPHTAARQLLLGAVGRHAGGFPAAPRHGRRDQTARPPVPRQPVQIGVRRGVRTGSRAAPHGGAGGEQDERLQGQLRGQGVEVAGAPRLGGKDRLVVLGGGGGEFRVTGYAGGVEDGGEGVLRRDAGDHVAEGVAVAHVARGERHLRTQTAQLRGQFGSTFCLLATTADQQQTLGALLRQPTGQMRTDATGAAGDQHRAVRVPVAYGCRVRTQRSPHQTPGIRTRRPHRYLILTLPRRQHGSQPGSNPLVPHPRHIDQTTPTARLLQTGHLTQRPHLRLHRVHHILRTHRRGTLRQHPQRRLDPGIRQSLDERHRRDRRGLLIPTQQRHHTRHLTGSGKAPGQSLTALLRLPRQYDDLGAGRLQRPPDLLDRPRATRRHHQPRPRQPAHRRHRHRTPHRPIPPRIQHRPLLTPPAPSRQRRDHRLPHLRLRAVDERGHALEVRVLHRAPEGRVHRIDDAVRTGRHHVLDPVALVLEGVRRQIDPAHRHPGEQHRPVDGSARHVSLRERRQEAVRTALVTAQRPHSGTGAEHAFLGFLDRHGQYGVGAGLDEDLVFLFGEQPHHRLEPDPLPQIRHPVPRVEPGGVQPLPGHRRVEGDGGRLGPDVGEFGEQVVVEGIHLRGVGGVVHRDTTGPHPRLLTFREEFVECVGLTGDDGGAGPVDGRDTDPALEPGETLLDALHRQRNGHHPALAGQLLQHQPRPHGHHPRPILQRQTTRHTRRSDLTLRMPHDRGRLHPERTPHRRQRHHHRPQHRLHHIHPGPQRIPRVPEHHIPQRPVDVRTQRLAALLHPRTEHRRGVPQIPPHPHPLRPLTREHEHHTGSGVAGSPDQAGHVESVREGGESGGPVSATCALSGEQHRAMREFRPARQE
ncbi:hypothetical protein Save01_09070 [Streptomyces avermitilis]